MKTYIVTVHERAVIVRIHRVCIKAKDEREARSAVSENWSNAPFNFYDVTQCTQVSSSHEVTAVAQLKEG